MSFKDRYKYTRPVDRATFDTIDDVPVRHVDSAYEILKGYAHHNCGGGWFADDMEFDIFRPQVWRLNNGRFIGGYVSSDTDMVVVCTDWTHDTMRDAAMAADSLAERDAECEREFRTAWSKCHDALYDLQQCRKAWQLSLRMQKASSGPALDMVAERMDEQREAARACIETLREYPEIRKSL